MDATSPIVVQARGVMLVVDRATLVVEHASDNLETLAPMPARDAIGRPLDEVLGPRLGRRVRAALDHWGRPLDWHRSAAVVEPAGIAVNVALHLDHTPETYRLVVELERVDAAPEVPTWLVVESHERVARVVAQATSVDEMWMTSIDVMRQFMGGIDQLLVCQYDDDGSGKFVAEAAAPGVIRFRDTRMRPSVRAVSTAAVSSRNAVKAVDDVRSASVELVPPPDERHPLDASDADLRAPNPVEADLLYKLGMTGFFLMAIERRDSVWGVLIGRHFSGPFLPPYAARSAAHELTQMLGTRLDELLTAQEERERDAVREVTEQLYLHARAGQDGGTDTAATEAALARLARSDGVIWVFDGDTHVSGRPMDCDVAAVASWVAANVGRDVVALTCLQEQAPELAGLLPGARGVLVGRDEENFTLWWRGPESPLPVLPAVPPQLSPSQQRLWQTRNDWRSRSEQQCVPWTAIEVWAVTEARQAISAAAFANTREALRDARLIQRSLLPDTLDHAPGWLVDAVYRPAAGGQTGGDWFDSFQLPNGTYAIVIGDVAGHGLSASREMGQLRNFLRAFLLQGGRAAEAIAALDEAVGWVLPNSLATVGVGVVDPDTGRVDLSSAGHPPPIIIAADGRAEIVDPVPAPPVGTGRAGTSHVEAEIPAGGALLAFTDGLVESRTMPLQEGIERLRRVAERLGPTLGAERLIAEYDWRSAEDDQCLIVLRRL